MSHKRAIKLLFWCWLAFMPHNSHRPYFFFILVDVNFFESVALWQGIAYCRCGVLLLILFCLNNNNNRHEKCHIQGIMLCNLITILKRFPFTILCVQHIADGIFAAFGKLSK